MFTLLDDLRYGVRMLLSAPRVTVAAVLSLALGIGANTAMFTVINAVMLEPLPYAEPDRLVMVWETASDSNRRPVAPANFIDWRRDARSFAGLAAWDEVSVNLTGTSRPEGGNSVAGFSRPERLRAISASGNLFDLLGVHAAIGRTLTMADEAADAPRVAVLTHGLWQRLFAASPSALGQTLVLDGQAAVVVGVLPPDFALATEIDVYLSGDRGVPRAHPFPGDITQVRDSHIIAVTGRLRDGVSVDQAQAEMSTIMRRLEQAYPGTNTALGARVVPLHDDLVADTRCCCCSGPSRSSCSSHVSTWQTCCSAVRSRGSVRLPCACRSAPPEPASCSSSSPKLPCSPSPAAPRD